jgi:hypothetical protein
MPHGSRFTVAGGAQSVHEPLAAQSLVHRLAPRQLIDQLVEVADLPHQRVVDLLDAHPTDRAGDRRGTRRARGQMTLQGGFVEAGEPLDDAMQLRLRAPLLLDLRHVVRVHRAKAGREYSMHVPRVGRPRGCVLAGHGRWRRRIVSTCERVLLAAGGASCPLRVGTHWRSPSH